MAYSDAVIQDAVGFLSYMGVLGFAGGGFLILATSGLCSVVHMLKHLIS